MAGECAAGIQRVQLDTGVPVVFGVLTTENVDQALERSLPDETNKGREAALTAVEMVRLLRRPCPGGRPAEVGWRRMLRLVLPKGSLEQATLELFAEADLAVRAVLGGRVPGARSTTHASTRCGSSGPRRSRVYVADGLFDLGITGRDWVEERGAEVVSLGELGLLQGDEQPDPRRAGRRRRLAGPSPSPTPPGGDAARARVAPSTPSSPGGRSETPGVAAEISFSYGATEAKVPDIADCVVEITETGRALRAAGLRIIDTLLVSHTELIANPRRPATPRSATPWTSC